MTQQHQRILCLRDHPEWSERAAVWFHKKWGIPLTAYQESIRACRNQPKGIPQWLFY